MNFLNKRVLVCGVALSGVSASILLKKLGAIVTIQDIKDKLPLDLERFLEKNYINTYLGKNPTIEEIDKFDLIVLSPGISSDLNFIKYAKTKIPVISEIELAYLNCNAPIIAITGTNGKTTTTSLMGEIMKTFNKETKVVGNIGIPFSQEVMEVSEKGIFIAEISSFQLENINKFRPKIATILNITPDHLNRHKTLNNYIKTKEKIFKNQEESDILILNYEDFNCLDMEKRAKSKVVYFSLNEVLNNNKVKVYLHNNFIYLNFKEKREKFLNVSDLKILGEHNIQNIMSCILMSYYFNLPLDLVRDIIKEFKGVEHRNEYVTTINNIEIYNDSKGTNPDASIKAIKSMKRPVILILGGYDKDTDFTDLVKSFENKVKKLIVFGECKYKIIEYCDKNNFKSYKLVNTLEEAVLTSYKNSNNGDCILFSPACASWDMFKNYEERGNLFKNCVFKLKGEII